MNENQLLKISLIVSVLGLFILIFAIGKIEVKEIDKINKLDENVKITGVVKKITNHNSTTFIEIERPERILVIVFDKIDLQKETKIEVVGALKEYQGKKEIVADEIKSKS